MKHEEHVLRMGDGNPNATAKIHNLRGAVEGRDGVAIVLGVLQKLEEVVSGGNSRRDVAGSNHGCSCWIWWWKQLAEELFMAKSLRAKSTTFEHRNVANIDTISGDW